MRLPQNIVSDKSDEDGVDPRDHNILIGGLKIVAHISTAYLNRLTKPTFEFPKTNSEVYY